MQIPALMPTLPVNVGIFPQHSQYHVYYPVFDLQTLLNLLTIKTPITEADAIRALSCKALCGLAKSEVVRQIVSKLSLFSSGQLQGKFDFNLEALGNSHQSIHDPKPELRQSFWD